MTSKELMRGLDRDLNSQPTSACLLYVANRAYDLTTEDGKALTDPTDWKHFLIECYHAQLEIEREKKVTV